MIKNKKLEQINKIIEAMIESSDKKQKEYQKEVDTAQTNFENLENKLSNVSLNDPEEYLKISEEHHRAKTLLELYIKKQKIHDESPLISEEEYKKMVSDIRESLEDTEEKAMLELKPLLMKIKEISDQLNDDLNLGSELLPIVQRKLFKEPKVKLLPNGNKLATMDLSYKQSHIGHTIRDTFNKKWIELLLEIEPPKNHQEYWGSK